MFVAWFGLLFCSFAVSVITLTYIQTRVARKFGWRALRERSLRETYWTNLSTRERLLLWPGTVLFFLTLISLTLWNLIFSHGG
ncbi:MAG: hypothetical protein JWM21_4476 [Acidobacteria bacterium]|nr:hypothetical protein [Acidobacteriota bacterium]